ncbi:hypothetical protein DSC45_05770 [Streptomyces sp. YIM 130001]|uniref:Uncharacterized protein n=1 Tax=Streptomyces triticagri TaxID=2293568 RepID=A0A372M232_9ACTN|nr:MULTISPECIES: hypothetical protein [Streptomyces]RFU84889.1 hypothetical protein DY218_20300 [Streptomyces triticagri]RII19502.1 hypothetical protein DSC45_05770 [Streptomyces sp. YIM 130001]
MAASAQLLLDALSKRPEPRDLPDLSLVSGPDSGLLGSCSCGCAEPPLTSEPPLADAAPLTSEPPLADAAPLTSEPTATGTASGLDPSVH